MYAGPAPPEWQLTRSPLRLGQAAGQIAEIAATDVICRPLVELARYCHEIDSAPYPRPTTNLGFPYFLWTAPASYQHLAITLFISLGQLFTLLGRHYANQIRPVIRIGYVLPGITNWTVPGEIDKPRLSQFTKKQENP